MQEARAMKKDDFVNASYMKFVCALIYCAKDCVVKDQVC